MPRHEPEHTRLAFLMGVIWMPAFLLGILALFTRQTLLLCACLLIGPTAFVAMLLFYLASHPSSTGEPASGLSLPQAAVGSLIFGCGWPAFLVISLVMGVIGGGVIALLLTLFFL